MQLSGKITNALPAREGTSAKGNAWKSQEFVLETFDQYPKHVCFQVFGGDKLQAFNIKVGESYLVDFGIDAREYNGRWYNTIDAFKVTPLNGSVPAGTDPFNGTQAAAPADAQPAQQNNDNVPF